MSATGDLPPTLINGTQHYYVDAEEEDQDDTRHLLVLYATETGTALDIAEQLAREAQRRAYDVRLASIDAYPLVRLCRVVNPQKR